LNERAKGLVERLAADPSASINSACDGWGETLAAYRFFNNPRVEPEKLLEPHRETTCDRMQEESVVLVVQDTTELDYSKHPAAGMGVLNEPHRRGFYDHTLLAFTPEGLCLGVLDAKFAERSPGDLGKSHQRKRQPIEERESYRWLEGYRTACQAASKTPLTQVVCVADCEADIYDLLREAQRQEMPAELLVRAKIDRCLPDKDPAGGPNEYRKAWNEVASGPVIATRQITLPQTPKRDARDVRLEVRAERLTLRAPSTRQNEEKLEFNLVLVTEIGSSEVADPVVWKLLTTLPVNSAESALKVVDYYVARWGVEVFFRIYKTGCRVEEIQLETPARLRNCLMLYKVIAWRVMYVTYLGRVGPDLPTSAVFAEEEWRPTWQIVTNQAPPKEPPPLKEFLSQLASLGGYNNRSHDPPPGPQVLWIGIRRMTDFAIAWRSFQDNQTTCV
jgi:hypothetical protein